MLARTDWRCLFQFNAAIALAHRNHNQPRWPVADCDEKTILRICFCHSVARVRVFIIPPSSCRPHALLQAVSVNQEHVTSCRHYFLTMPTNASSLCTLRRSPHPSLSNTPHVRRRGADTHLRSGGGVLQHNLMGLQGGLESLWGCHGRQNLALRRWCGRGNDEKKYYRGCWSLFYLCSTRT